MIGQKWSRIDFRPKSLVKPYVSCQLYFTFKLAIPISVTQNWKREACEGFGGIVICAGGQAETIGNETEGTDGACSIQFVCFFYYCVCVCPPSLLC